MGAVISLTNTALGYLGLKTSNANQDDDDMKSSHEVFRYLEGLRDSGAIGLDIGGTAGKIVYLQKNERKEILRMKRFGQTGVRVEELEMYSPFFKGTLHFLKWSTHRIQPYCDRLISERLRGTLISSPRPSPRESASYNLYATGGGAHKFEEAVSTSLGIKYHKVGEFDALVLGFRHILQFHPNTVYTMKDGIESPVNFNPTTDFPCALCNIGSGVSVLKITDSSHERIGGTSIGGSTFLGLCKLIISEDIDFPTAIERARKGNTNDVNITVGDVYGEKAEQVLGLPSHIPASSFGKLVGMKHCGSVSKDSIAAAILDMTTQAIQQVAAGLAKNYGCQTLFFTGGFLRGNDISQTKLSNYCSLIDSEALFVQHADYAGALGCLIKTFDSYSGADNSNTNTKEEIKT